MSTPQPLPSPALYWRQDDTGGWQPMRCEHGIEYRLSWVMVDGERETFPSNHVAAVAGPLMRPKGGA